MAKYLFTPENLSLIQLFKNLGIKNLRIGGNTADRPSVGIPSHGDIDNLFAFDTKFCGPSTTPGKAEWARNFANDFGPSGKVRLIAQHSYPGGSGRKITDVAAGRDQMLSPEFAASNDKFEKSFAPAALASGVPYRLEETNNYFHGGAQGVSNSFASALWGLDYMYWWAERGAAGINFHTGDQVAAGEQQAPCWYALFWKASDGYSVHPLGYATKAFDLGSHGKIVPTTVNSNPDHLNVAAYGTISTGNKLNITLINKEHAVGAREIVVRVDPGISYSQARIMYLSSPKNDVAAETGVTLGGKSISNDGSWTESWTDLKTRTSDGRYTVTLPPASAAILELTRPGAATVRLTKPAR